MDPFDVIADLILQSTKPIQAKGGIAESDVRALHVQPWSMIVSDGGSVAEDDPSIGHTQDLQALSQKY
ncbi:MAG: hypothetical protein ACJA01_000693 [Saprospiraceae bacterium]|jgi:hypothetical protein